MEYRIAVLAAALACAPVLAQDTAEQARLVAVERGCYTCHGDKPLPAGSTPPSAPSWREIAVRYRGQADAGERLVALVVGGSGERHWSRSAFAGMLPNEAAVTPEEARQLVRWILAR